MEPGLARTYRARARKFLAEHGKVNGDNENTVDELVRLFTDVQHASVLAVTHSIWEQLQARDCTKTEFLDYLVECMNECQEEFSKRGETTWE
jgi:hypothetical protein